MGTSGVDSAAPRPGSPTAILDRVVALVEDGRYEEADTEARGLSYLGLVGGIAEPMTFREGALTAHWAQVRRRPALIALAALLRQQVAGDLRAMDADLVRAARTVGLQMSSDPVRRVSDLALQTLCLLLGSRTDEALAVARRAAVLLQDLGRDLGKSRKHELASSACDLAGMLLVLDEYSSALQLWGWVRSKISDPSSPLLVQADVGLACIAEISGTRGLAVGRFMSSEHEEAPGMWNAMRLSAEAWGRMDRFDPHGAIALARQAIAMLPDPYALGPLTTVHVAALISVGHPSWAVEYLDAVEEFGLPATKTSALGRMRLLARVVAYSAAGDAAAAAEAEGRMGGDAQLHPFARSYRLLWAGDAEMAIAAAATMTRPVVTPRYEAAVRFVSAAAHRRQGMDAEALVDLDRIGAISLTGGVRGIGLLLPRSDIAGLAELAESQGTSEIRRLLPDPETLTLDAAPTVHLKPRERQVLGLAASGLTNAQIAAQLFLSPNTVKYHLARAYRTLGVATRDEAVAAAGLHRQLSDPTRDV